MRSRFCWHSFNRTTMELKQKVGRRRHRRQPTFNRTTMELKPHLAIGPHADRSPFNRTTMELKQKMQETYERQALSFNRTTMELKRWQCFKCEMCFKLLIEPLWNWNRSPLFFANPYLQTFNRTTMELKQWRCVRGIRARLPFNRTTMELKLGVRAWYMGVQPSF